MPWKCKINNTLTMKKLNILLLLFLLFASLVSYTQNELWYAIQINNYKSQITKDSSAKYPELAAFVKDPYGSFNVSSDTIKNQFDRYIKDASMNNKAGNAGDQYVASIISSIESILSPKIKSADLLTALTDVIIDRAKQELAAAYFNRMTNSFETKKLVLDFGCSTKEITLNKLFPDFYLMVKNSEANMNMQLGNTFITAIKRDIASLNSNIDKYVIPDCYKRKNTYTIYKYSYDLFEKFRANRNIIVALREVRPMNPSNEAEHIINLISGISESMVCKDNLNWIDLKKEIKGDKNILKYYMSLLSLNKNIRPSLEALNINITQDNMDSYYYTFSTTFDLLESIQIQINSTTSSSPVNYNVQGTTDQSQSDTNIENNYQASQVISDLLTIVEMYSRFTKDPDKKNQIDKGLRISGELINFYTAISNKNYSEAVLATLAILNEYSDGKTLPAEMIQFMTLAADLSQAENAEDARNILDAAILPVGSYKIKRSVAFSTSINSYIGVNGGVELLDYKNLMENAAGYAGPFLPIGIDLSWSKGTEQKMAFSHTVYISILDLGVLAGYRFQNSNDSLSVASVPQIKFEHVISPGVFYVLGVKNSPLSFGIGTQYSPRLRAITQDDIELNVASSVRFTAFVAVDIPLFNLGIRGNPKWKK